MMGKLALSLIVLAITTLFLDTFANTISTGQLGKRNVVGFGKCLFKCRRSGMDPVCVVIKSGKHLTFARTTYDCLKKNCGEGGVIKYPGTCLPTDVQPRKASHNPASVGPNVGKTPPMTLQDHLNSAHQ